MQTSNETQAPEVSTSDKARIDEINQLHGEIVELKIKGHERSIRIGELLHPIWERETKQETWIKWINANLTFTRQAAANYLRAYRNRDEIRRECKSGLHKDAMKWVAGRSAKKPKQPTSAASSDGTSEDWQQKLLTHLDPISDILTDHCAEELSGESGERLRVLLEALSTELEMFHTPLLEEVAA